MDAQKTHLPALAARLGARRARTVRVAFPNYEEKIRNRRRLPAARCQPVHLSFKLLFATGVRDIMPNIEGFAACWGVLVIHCPYCPGYEFKGQPTGIRVNGDAAVDFSRFIGNWTACWPAP